MDKLWNQAMTDAIKNGEDFTRYRFANLVAEAERDKLQSAAEWCRMCERKGVFNEKATGDEANSPKVLGKG